MFRNYLKTAFRKSRMPVIKSTARVSPVQKIVAIGTRKFAEKHMYYADSNFLTIFHYPLLSGSIHTALDAPNSIVLTEATALKYFGRLEDAMGKSVHIDNDDLTLQVTGVLKNIPTNSHL